MPDFNMKFGIFLFYGYDTPSMPAGRSVFCRLLRSCVSKRSRFPTFGCHSATGAASRLASQPRIKTANRFTDCIAEPQPRLCRFIVCASALTAGVDIEFIRPRDFKALSALVCTQEEQDYLETANWPSETFYRLWCFKEGID